MSKKCGNIFKEKIMQWFAFLTTVALTIFIGVGAYLIGRSDENRKWAKRGFELWREMLVKHELKNDIKSLMDEMEWRCMACEKMRPDKFISVKTHDLSRFHKCEPETFKLNVKYCNDNLECTAIAEAPEIWINWPRIRPGNLEKAHL